MCRTRWQPGPLEWSPTLKTLSALIQEISSFLLNDWGICLLFSAENLVRGDHPNSWKNAPRMQGQMKIFRVGSRQFRESLWELLRELWVSYWSSRERPFREWNFVFREWNFQFRELLREYPGSLRELREWPFHSWNWGGPQASERRASPR